MGIYKRLEDVPEEYRFEQYTGAYEGRNVWAEYVESLPSAYTSTFFEDSLRKAEETWTAHMDDRGRHYALATPEDVDTWVSTLAETRKLSTVNSVYFVRVEGLYDWLQSSVDHPHRYQPVLMAASAYETTGAVWRTKFDR